MKKLQLSIVILSFLWISHAIVGVFSVIPAYESNHSDSECCLQGAFVSVESNIADRVFLYPNFDPNCFLHPHISSDIGIEDMRFDVDIDTADSSDGFEMNDRVVSLTSPALKETPAIIVRSIALKIFNFPPEVSRLRI
jgi:hypothetical protein